MFLQTLANSVPENVFTQEDCWNIFINSETPKRLKDRSASIIKKVLLGGKSGIEKRHFALKNLSRLFELDAETLNREFEIEAPKLSTSAVKKALDQAKLKPQELDALLVCTCTGYICPGLSSHISEQLGMRSDSYLQDIVGLGCGAAIPTMRSANHILKAHKDAKVAVVAVEICSAAFYLDDDPGVLVSACLFSDGASASIWSNDDKMTGLSCNNFDTIHRPENRSLLRFENRFGKLRNLLHKTVPQKASEAVHHLFNKIDHSKIGQIISHSGGRDIIDAIENAIPGHTLPETKTILKNHGNMSSPSVLFALKEYLDNKKVDKDLWLTSFGAGFSCHSCSIGNT